MITLVEKFVVAVKTALPRATEPAQGLAPHGPGGGRAGFQYPQQSSVGLACSRITRDMLERDIDMKVDPQSGKVVPQSGK